MRAIFPASRAALVFTPCDSITPTATDFIEQSDTTSVAAAAALATEPPPVAPSCTALTWPAAGPSNAAAVIVGCRERRAVVWRDVRAPRGEDAE